jgi:hypothetical protein
MPPVESYEGRDAGDVKDHPLDRCGHEIDGDEDRPRRGEGREVVCVDPRARPKDLTALSLATERMRVWGPPRRRERSGEQYSEDG